MSFSNHIFYEHINFDVNKKLYRSIAVKQGDTGSRGFFVKVIQNSEVIDISDMTMTFYCKKPDGTKVYIDAVKDGDKFRVDLTNQVFAVPGEVECELTLRGQDGEQISNKTFKMVVDSSIQEGSIVSKDERGILDRAFELAEDIIPRLELLDVELLEDLQNDITTLKNDVEAYMNIVKVESWEDVQKVVRAGIADKVFTIGDQLVSGYGETDQIIWDVIGINHDKPTDPRYEHSLTIQAHDCIINCQFDAPEALYFAETELAPGTHIFTFSSGQYKFITTQAVHAGGQVYISSWETEGYVPTKITTYAEDRTTAIETNLDVTAATGTDTLVPVNNHTRCRYGSNNYLESSIREWLNTEGEYTWTPSTEYDRPSTSAPYTGGGFLNVLDPELASVIGAVDKQVARNTLTDGGDQDLFSDKVFLLSRTEVYGGTEGDTAGEEPYPYYSALASSPTTNELAGRIKLLNGTPRAWWLRSPYVGSAYHPRSMHPSGQIYSNIATSALGLSPACCII